MNYYKHGNLLILLILTSCSAYRPLNHPPYSIGFGYSEEQIDSNTFIVRYDGGRNSEHKVLRKHLVRRAAELCPGSFRLSQYTLKRGFVIHARKTFWPYITARLTCTENILDESVLFPHVEDDD